METDGMEMLGFKKADLGQTGFQYLEDLSCAYWYSEVLFTALELELFRIIGNNGSDLSDIAARASCRADELSRLLRCMERMGLVGRDKGCWYNSQITSRFLVPGKPSYMGDFFLYRQYMRSNWTRLSDTVSLVPRPKPEKTGYRDRNVHYVKAMDTIIKQKAGEVAELFSHTEIEGPILDVGGGAGSMIRALCPHAENRDAVLFDLPETVDVARQLYSSPRHWEGIRAKGGDFRTFRFQEQFGLIILSNFLHAYGRQEAKDLLGKAVSLLKKDGRIVIHDYFPDRKGGHPQKGPLYDLAMMLNTYNGTCHEANTLVRWIERFNLPHVEIRDLTTDTAVIVAGGREKIGLNKAPWLDWAGEIGFDRCVGIDPKAVVTAPWVEFKCRYGCDMYGKNLQCPPNGMRYTETRILLDAYSRAVLVQGAPPGKEFHDRLLAFERKAFLEGFPKALVFGAGPCPVCPACPEDGSCRNHKLARPAMESCGIDVYSTVRNAGIPLTPVREKGQYVKYMGLLMLE
ncbi:MAG: DUF2284 domain-containing protein [Desulfobacterales bacterium]|nr:DUF2284 domain-containing protein [Desulfobacterales bacterium]